MIGTFILFKDYYQEYLQFQRMDAIIFTKDYQKNIYNMEE